MTKDTKNKMFLATLAMCGIATVTVVARTLAAVLGANTQISSCGPHEYSDGIAHGTSFPDLL